MESFQEMYPIPEDDGTLADMVQDYSGCLTCFIAWCKPGDINLNVWDKRNRRRRTEVCLLVFSCVYLWNFLFSL